VTQQHPHPVLLQLFCLRLSDLVLCLALLVQTLLCSSDLLLIQQLISLCAFDLPALETFP
jgi:hypothetical protein